MQFSGVTMTGGYSVLTGAAPAGDQYWANVSFLSETTSTNAQTNNVFLDSSSSPKTLTNTGTLAQGTFSPFTLASGSSYSPSVNGGSGLFSGGQLSFTEQTISGDFTAECWFYRTGNAAGGYSIIFGGNALSGGSPNCQLVVYNDGSVAMILAAGTVIGVSGTAVTTNAWHHIVWVKAGTSAAIFVDGTRVGTGTTSANLIYQVISGCAGVGANYYAQGYLSSCRVVNAAVYNPANSTLTVPTTPLTAIANTNLLCNFTNAGIYDATTTNDLSLLVNAKVSTAQAKFGTTSMSFGGDNSLVQQISKTTINSSADFTLECWFYQSAGSTNYVPLICDSTAVYYFPLIIDYGTGGAKVAGAVGLYTTSSGGITTGTGGLFSTGVWNHIAVSRSSGTTKVFVNGTVRLTTATALGTFTVDQIGGASVSGYTLNGFLDQVRITNGVARYTSDFAVPTAAFPTSA